jgi:hypothetical protein
MEGERNEGNVGEKNWREGRRYGLGIMNGKGIDENGGKRNLREGKEKGLE